MTPLFICTGFLDSGKTTLVKETLMEQEWIQDGLTLLIVCEEGEEEYSKEYLKEKNMVLLQVEEMEELNAAFFKNCEKTYRPTQVVIEYNGMWKLEDLLRIRYPRNWQIQGIYSTIDGSTLDMYLKNMRNILMGQLMESELIIINRCPEGLDRASFRRAVRVQNPGTQLIFEGMDGKIIQPGAEDLPYDVKADRIVVADEDYGIWFVDAGENPERYLDKEIEFKAQMLRPRGMKATECIPGRQIMTCCADDIDFYGYPCKTGEILDLEEYDWVTVRVSMEYQTDMETGEGQPILYLLDLQPAEEPEEEVVSV